MLNVHKTSTMPYVELLAIFTWIAMVTDETQKQNKCKDFQTQTMMGIALGIPAIFL